MTEPESTGEQMALDTEAAIEQAVEEWLDDNSSSAVEEGEFIRIRRDELVEKMLTLVLMALLPFTEN